MCDYTMNYNRQYKTLFYFYRQKKTTTFSFFLVEMAQYVLLWYTLTCLPVCRVAGKQNKKFAEIIKLKNYDYKDIV